MKKWKFAVDTGGTFTDIIGLDPEGKYHALKLLSNSPEYKDAGIEGIRRMLKLKQDKPLPERKIEAIRLGTTVATNSLLERKGGNVALFITKGFSDLLEIGYQNRPDIFSLCIRKPEMLYSSVFEIEERIDSRGNVVTELNRKDLKKSIVHIKKKGLNAVAVVLLHSWRNPVHELICEDLCKAYGFSEVFLSHKTMNSVRIVSRGQSTVLDAYLGTVILQYLEKIRKWTGNIKIEFMQSSGNLTATEAATGKSLLFSGPAGGVIATGNISSETGLKGAIGFDMGGTSTDVSRYDGDLEMIYEKIIEGIEFQTESLNIITIASGGGSKLWFDGQKMRVGPESAGAQPGPACYGFGGPLTITDANLLTGRIIPDYFPRTFGHDRKSMLDAGITRRKFEDLARKIRKPAKRNMTAEEVAQGFLRIANEKMAMAIKEISISKGFDVRNYALVCYGGAAGQHACEVADILGIKKILFHPLSSLLSAYGIGLSRESKRASHTFLKPYNKRTHREMNRIFSQLKKDILKTQQGKYKSYILKKELDLRPAGTDTFLKVPYGTFEDTIELFRKKYKRLFGFYLDSVNIEVVNARIEIQNKESFFPKYCEKIRRTNKILLPVSSQKIHYHSGFIDVPVYLSDALSVPVEIKGPACIVDGNSTFIVNPQFVANTYKNGMIILEMISQPVREGIISSEKDPVLLEVFNNLFMGIAAEMGYTLKNSAHSVNIKERLDFSCAIFDRNGDLVANAPHIPVHLGSMVDTVKTIIKDKGTDLKPGDFYLSNNPFKGGSHLPDLTIVNPVFSDAGEIIFFVASRGHHADIGGISPGSLPPYVEHINQEGVMIDSFLLVRDSKFKEKEIKKILSDHPYPVRNIQERLFDLQAQLAACNKGAKELEDVIKRYGLATVINYMMYVQENALFSVKQALFRFLGGRKNFSSSFEDHLDDGSRINVRIVIKGGDNPPETLKSIIDFTGTDPQHRDDNLNAPLSVTRSAVLYVLRTITGTDIPLNSGCLQMIDLFVPENSLLNPLYPSPVASGNVETSQRIVDVLLGALNISAASQGTMNNLLFEVKGDYPYYETIAGGSGAMEGCPGASGVQVHMTNTRITDPEILEYRHPDIRLVRFTLRKGSGGKGFYNGGDGVIREILFLKPATVTIISERRRYEPYGLSGGCNGKAGANFLKRGDGTTIEIPHRVELKVEAGESVIIETPGGGGYGQTKK